MVKSEFEFPPFEYQEELNGLIDLFESWQARIGVTKFKGSKVQRKNALKRLSTLKSLYKEYNNERESAKTEFVNKLRERAESLRTAANNVENTKFWWELYSMDYPEKLRAEALKLERTIEFYSN